MTRIVAMLLAVCGVAAAAPTAQEKLADREFGAGKKLMAAGKIAEACEHFQASFAADPALGTLLNLADCHARLGKTATAMFELRTAVERAVAANDDRLDYARGQVAALEPKLSKLVIALPASPKSIVVTRDGAPMQVDGSVAVDPGEYRFEAKADGYATWSQSVAVTKPGITTITVVLVPIGQPAATPTAPTTPTTTVAMRDERPVSVVSGPIDSPVDLVGWTRTPHLVVAGAASVVAAVGVVVTAMYGVEANRGYNATKQQTDKQLFDADYELANGQYHRALAFGLGTLIVGGAAAYMWLTIPSERSTQVTGVVSPQMSGVVVRGSF